MIDIQTVRDKPDLIKQKSAEKGHDVDVEKLLELDKQRRKLNTQLDELRAERNALASATKGKKPDQEQISRGKVLKAEIAELEGQYTDVDTQYTTHLKSIPNIAMDHVPVGESEAENYIARTEGDFPQYSFTPKPHWELMENKDMLDKERAAKISGSRFVYLKGGIVKLQFAIMQYVMDLLTDEEFIKKMAKANKLKVSTKPFTPILPPAMLRTEPYTASARLDAEETTYKLADDDLWLNASAEHTLCTMYWNEILSEEELPIRYIGYSPSFRREAGSYGKDTEGIIRLHQFDKLEMQVFSTEKTGFDEHKLLISIQEYLVSSLGLHYNFVEKCTADIGKPNASGTDIDCWFSGQDRFIETHTADYMTDYQARDLNTRYKKADGSVELVHTNDATAFALGRIMAAIIENYQQEDGSIAVPDVLKPYFGKSETI